MLSTLGLAPLPLSNNIGDLGQGARVRPGALRASPACSWSTARSRSTRSSDHTHRSASLVPPCGRARRRPAALPNRCRTGGVAAGPGRSDGYGCAHATPPCGRPGARVRPRRGRPRRGAARGRRRRSRSRPAWSTARRATRSSDAADGATSSVLPDAVAGAEPGDPVPRAATPACACRGPDRHRSCGSLLALWLLSSACWRRLRWARRGPPGRAGAASPRPVDVRLRRAGRPRAAGRGDARRRRRAARAARSVASPRNAIVACWDRFEEQAERVRRGAQAVGDVLGVHAAAARRRLGRRRAGVPAGGALPRGALLRARDRREPTRQPAVEALRAIHARRSGPRSCRMTDAQAAMAGSSRWRLAGARGRGCRLRPLRARLPTLLPTGRCWSGRGGRDRRLRARPTRWCRPARLGRVAAELGRHLGRPGPAVWPATCGCSRTT